MQVLALDPRRPLEPASRLPRGFIESADDYLVRPTIWVDRKQVQAPYFSYALRFNVSASVNGSIPIDDAEQISEFKRAVNLAIRGELTTAERKSWEAGHSRLDVSRMAERHRWIWNREFLQHVAPGLSAAEFHAVAADEAAKASRYYTQVHQDIEAPRRYDGTARACLSRHEEVMAGLVRLGMSFLQTA